MERRTWLPSIALFVLACWALCHDPVLVSASVPRLAPPRWAARLSWTARATARSTTATRGLTLQQVLPPDVHVAWELGHVAGQLRAGALDEQAAGQRAAQLLGLHLPRGLLNRRKRRRKAREAREAGDGAAAPLSALEEHRDVPNATTTQAGASPPVLLNTTLVLGLGALLEEHVNRPNPVSQVLAV